MELKNFWMQVRHDGSVSRGRERESERMSEYSAIANPTRWSCGEEVKNSDTKAELSTALVAFLSSKTLWTDSMPWKSPLDPLQSTSSTAAVQTRVTCAHCKTSNLVESRHVYRWDQH